MSDYTKSTNFATKDALSSGNALKIVKGTELILSSITLPLLLQLRLILQVLLLLVLH
jgi:hypothetical protein